MVLIIPSVFVIASGEFGRLENIMLASCQQQRPSNNRTGGGKEVQAF